MSHELEMNGKDARMFYAGLEPWHGLGIGVEREVTAAAAIKLAGLDLVATKEPLYTRGNLLVCDKYAVVRQDCKVLGVVGSKYEIIQNKDCFDFMDSIVGEGQAIYHTAGSLYDGKRVFITAKLPDSMMIGGTDKINKYLLLVSSHDGSMCLQLMFTSIRVVCANTCNAALSGKFASKAIIRHCTNYKEKIGIARDALGLSKAYYDKMEIEFNLMLDKEMSDSRMEQFTEYILPNKIDNNGKITFSAQMKKVKEEIFHLFKEGAGVKEVANTHYAAYNAVTEYISHLRIPEKSTQSNKMSNIIWGSGANLRQKAFNVLSTTGKV